MKRSTDRILTTHVGSLIRPPALQEIMRAKQGGQSYDQAAYEACLKQSVADVVGRQAEIGVDVITAGAERTPSEEFCAEHNRGELRAKVTTDACFGKVKDPEQAMVQHDMDNLK